MDFTTVNLTKRHNSHSATLSARRIGLVLVPSALQTALRTSNLSSDSVASLRDMAVAAVHGGSQVEKVLIRNGASFGSRIALKTIMPQRSSSVNVTVLVALQI